MRGPFHISPRYCRVCYSTSRKLVYSGVAKTSLLYLCQAQDNGLARLDYCSAINGSLQVDTSRSTVVVTGTSLAAGLSVRKNERTTVLASSTVANSEYLVCNKNVTVD